MHGIWNIPTFFIRWTKLHDATQNVVGSVPDYLWQSRRFALSERHFFPKRFFFLRAKPLSSKILPMMFWHELRARDSWVLLIWWRKKRSACLTVLVSVKCFNSKARRASVPCSEVPKCCGATPQWKGQHVPHHEVSTYARFSAVSCYECFFLVSYLTMPSNTEII